MKRRILSVLLAAVLAVSLVPGTAFAIEDSVDLPVAIKEYNGHTYKLYDTNLSWTDAKDYCEQLGGHLVTITSAEEQSVIENLLEEGEMHQYWIGLSHPDGTLRWVTNEPYSYSNWDPGEPNLCKRADGEEEYFIHIYNVSNPAINGSERFRWNDMFNDNTFPGEENNFSLQYVGFICEWDANTTGNTSWIIDRVRAYTSDEACAQYNAIMSKADSLSPEAFLQKMTEFFNQYGILDVREGYHYFSSTSNERVAYLALTTDDTYLAWQYHNWLRNTKKGKAAQGLLVVDGLIFNNELGDYLDISTYMTNDYPEVNKYKDMLYDFLDFEGFEIETMAYINSVNKMAKNANKTGKEYAKNLIKKINNCTDRTERRKLMSSADAIGLYLDVKTEGSSINDVKLNFIMDENSGFGKFAKSMGAATKVLDFGGLAIQSVIDFIELDSKLEAYEQYRGFLNEVAVSTDLPLNLRLAAYMIEGEIDDGAWGSVKNLTKEILNKTGATGKVNDAILESVLGEIGASTLAEWLAVIELEAFFINQVVDIGALVKGVYFVEGYSYLGEHYKNKLKQSKTDFLKNQSEENAWNFFKTYNLLYKLRYKGEEAFLKMSKVEGLVSIFSDFGYMLREEVANDTMNMLKTRCRFTVDQGVEIPESVTYIAKAVVSCPVNVEIYAPDGTYITTLEDGVESDMTNEYGRFAVFYRPYFDSYGKVICMSQPGNYSFKIAAVEDGLVSMEVAQDINEIPQLYSVSNVELNKGEILVTSLTDITETQTFSIQSDGQEIRQGAIQSVLSQAYQPAESIDLNEPAMTLHVGEETLLTVSILPSTASNQTVTWLSSAPDVASVKDGRITALRQGNAAVYCVAQDNLDIQAICEVTVAGNHPSFSSYLISDDSVTLILSDTPSVNATAIIAVYGHNGQMLRNGTANITAGGRPTIDVAVDLTNASSARAFLLDAAGKPLTGALDLELPSAS